MTVGIYKFENLMMYPLHPLLPQGLELPLSNCDEKTSYFDMHGGAVASRCKAECQWSGYRFR